MRAELGEQYLDLRLPAEEKPRVLGLEGHHPRVRAGDDLRRRLGTVQQVAEPRGLLFPLRTVGVGKVQPDPEAEPGRRRARVERQRHHPITPLIDAGEADQLFAVLGPAVLQERRAEHQRRVAAGGDGPVVLFGNGGPQREIAPGYQAFWLNAHGGPQVAVNPGPVGVGVDDE